MHFYDSKSGREFSDAPVRRLSQSYQLEAVGGHTVTSKQVFKIVIFTLSRNGLSRLYLECL